MKIIKKPFLKSLRNRKLSRGQSFVELALVVPILLLILLGVVEVAIFMGRYLDVLDLTREAARFASGRVPYLNNGADPRPATADYDCSTPDNFDFYYDTACIFSPPSTADCEAASDPFCNGFNSFITFNPATDDVVISVFTIESQVIQQRWPSPNGSWALSNYDTDTTNNDNYKRDCDGNTIRTDPYYTNTFVQNFLDDSSSTTPKKGYVAVEFYYCYEQVLGIPILTDIVPNPIQIHAYTFMPLPAAQPTRAP
jgi:hypothetical protein